MMWPCTRHTTFVKNLTVQTRNLDSRVTVEGPVPHWYVSCDHRFPSVSHKL